MNEVYEIVFCYSPFYVTKEVIELARRELPEGFRLATIEKQTPAVDMRPCIRLSSSSS
jgi:hypothetical protein